MGYPEHEKVEEVGDKSQVIGEFLEWAAHQKGGASLAPTAIPSIAGSLTTAKSTGTIAVLGMGANGRRLGLVVVPTASW